MAGAGPVFRAGCRAGAARRQVKMVIVLLSVLPLSAGFGLAWVSLRHRGHAPVLERCSGLCLLVGLCIIGLGLQAVR
ncbi:hypothetical protein AEGHOMDF_2050 [Methylobacterium soli]|nr:hypothetical protein AEGHOMDF_2050 [Methylobacterium soli]